jgi:lipid-A-disaccharide synthase
MRLHAGRQTAAPPHPAGAVALEFARALCGAAALPFRCSAFLLRRRELRQLVRADLATDPPAEPAEGNASLPIAGLPPRGLRIFLSCAEASGELHACNAVSKLRALLRSSGAPEPVFTGLGGSALAAAGVEVLDNPIERSTMGIGGALAQLPYYLSLLHRVARHFSMTAPDLCLAIDSPALNVPLGRIARRYGVRVAHLVAPQYWAWAPWRVHGYARAVDRALTIFPFEPAWFARHGVDTVHVGHPILDAQARVPPPAPDRPAAGRDVLVLLPGSRAKVIDLSLPWMLAAAARLRLSVPGLRVVVAQTSRGDLADRLRGHVARARADAWAEIELGDLHACLARARAALAVSGTVLLDLLHHRVPTVVVYRFPSGASLSLYRALLTTPWFSSPNLLAGREILPEFGFSGLGPFETVSRALERCYKDEAWRKDCIQGMDQAAERLGSTGALSRAARAVLELAAVDPLERAARGKVP